MKKKIVRLLAAIVAICSLVTAFAFSGCIVVDDPATKYAVTYLAGEGATGTAPAGGEYEEGATFKLPEATGLSKDDHTFDKWNDGVTDYAAGATYTMPAHAVTFTAKWKQNEEPPAITHTVTFDPNNEENVWTETVNDGATVSEPVTELIHPQGKHFMCWAYDGAEYDFNQPVTGNMELTAVWGWKFTFLAGEGATGTVEPIFAKSYARVTLPDGTGLSNDGKVFDGWTDGTDNYKAGEVVQATSNKSFTAVWKTEQTSVQYTVTYSTTYYAEGEAPASETKSAGDKITLPQNTFTPKPEYSVYVFVGWYVKGESGTLYQPGEEYTMPEKDVTFMAKWEKGKFTVTYKSGENATGSDITETLSAGKITLKSADAFTPEENYVFAGWKIEGGTDDAVYGASVEFNLSQNVTFVAQWSRLFVTYDADYSIYLFLNLSENSGYLEIWDEAAETVIDVPFTYVLNDGNITVTLDGKNFEGTFDGKTLNIQITYGGTAYLFGSAPAVEPQQPVISFDANGGSGAAPSAAVEYNETSEMFKITLPANSYTAPEGKTFKCWEINGKTYKANSSYMADCGETVTIKAVWEDKPAETVPTGVVFNGSCTVPAKTFLGQTTGGQTYVKFIVDTEKNEITYYISDGIFKTVTSFSDNSNASYKPDNYGADALYYTEIKMADNISYSLLIKADLTKLWLCDVNDELLDNGEFTAAAEDGEWVTIYTGEGTEFYKMCENGVQLIFEQPFENNGTEFVGIQFSKNSLGLGLKTIFVKSTGEEGVLTSTVAFSGASAENGNLLVFGDSSSTYQIVIGKKSDGNYYVTSFRYGKTGETDTTERVLIVKEK